MIVHVSIPARDPAHVAKVLAELAGWQARPFLGPLPGAFMLMAEDGQGTAIEVYPENVVLTPGTGEAQGTMEPATAPALYPFHFLLALDIDPGDVIRIGAREGWRTLRCWRGPPGQPMFELVELWVENRVMIEIATPAMLPDYLKVATAEAHDRAIAAMRVAARPG